MVRLLEDSGSESDEGGVELVNGSDFKVNEEYARKFDYNKKREELRRLEDKFGPASKKRKRDDNGESVASSEEDSSDDEEEDDDAGLATEALDAEIFATLNAIRSKDPRVYDSSTTFYTPFDDDANGATTTNATTEEKTKPMFLRDYHRENILREMNGDGGDDEKPKTYAEEQADLKASIVKEIHNAAADDESDEDDESDSDSGFLKAKEKPKRAPKAAAVELDIENADKDPETFLSNFMSSRAWAAPARDLQPFESDDDDEERRAEEYEEAYNLRFEDPEKSNEKLLSHARDFASKYSVRREEKSARQKKRDKEKEQKEEAKKELQEEKARLRKLRIEDMEEKARRIKQAAGISHKSLDDKEWARLLDNDWDDSKWDQEMQNQFGDEYYAAGDVLSDDEDGEAGPSNKSKKIHKPKWDDDIDIKDLVPDFEEEEEANFSLSEDGEDGEDAEDDSKSTKKTSKQHKKERSEKKKAARLERAKIEALVDDQLKFDMPFLSNSKFGSGGFRYRETSPTSYGLTARDILMADDTQLNAFAGLKKLASFRDPEKKRKDEKKLGKKARLRQWRKDTFGNEEGPRDEDFVKRMEEAQKAAAAEEDGAEVEEGGVDIREGGERKKKRRHKKKKVDVEA